MSLAQPILLDFGGYINPEKDTLIYFKVLGGDRWTNSILTIYNNINLQLVAEITQEDLHWDSSTFVTTIPANTCSPVVRDAQGNIIAGSYYMYITTVSGETKSPQSNRQVFFGYTRPELVINPLPQSRVTAFGHMFTANYSQAEGMQLSSYHFEVASDANENSILYFSPVRYYGTRQEPTTIAEKIEGFQEYNFYYIRAVIQTVYGQERTSDWYKFDCRYLGIYQDRAKLSLVENCKNGSVTITVTSHSREESLCKIKILRQPYPFAPLKQYTCVYEKENTFTNAALNFTFEDYTMADNLLYAYYLVFDFDENVYVVHSYIKHIRIGGIWLCDREGGFQLNIAPSFGETVSNIFTGVNSTFGQKYPIITANGSLNYQTGSLSFMPYAGDAQDRTNITQQRNQFIDFVTHNRNKILRDWNGNYWLVSITGSPSTSYVANYGMGLVSVSCSWTEIGDPFNPEDMKKAGLGL